MGDPTKIWTKPNEMDIPVQFDLTTGTARVVITDKDSPTAPVLGPQIPSSLSPIPGMPLVGGKNYILFDAF